jgi:TfuA protein
MPDRPVVFLGPSLAREQAAQLLPGAIFCPPIRRGDLRSLLDEPPPAVGIVDGEFFQSLAVSPKEILPLLERGVPVYGAASMGALRAVELESYGMRGVGRIFELFRSGRLTADDEVALMFCPATLRPLSEPLVNIRLALSAAHRAGLISLAELIGVTRRMKALYFPERTRQRLFAELEESTGAERATRVRQWWLAAAPDTKAEDARLLLLGMAERRAS